MRCTSSAQRALVRVSFRVHFHSMAAPSHTVEQGARASFVIKNLPRLSMQGDIFLPEAVARHIAPFWTGAFLVIATAALSITFSVGTSHLMIQCLEIPINWSSSSWYSVSYGKIAFLSVLSPMISHSIVFAQNLTLWLASRYFLGRVLHVRTEDCRAQFIIEFLNLARSGSRSLTRDRNTHNSESTTRLDSISEQGLRAQIQAHQILLSICDEPLSDHRQYIRDAVRAWHPDKNRENQEFATLVFQTLQENKHYVERLREDM